MAMTRLVGKAYHSVVRWGVLLGLLNLIVFLVLYFSSDKNLPGLFSDFGGILIPTLACFACFGISKTANKRLGQVKYLPAVLGGAALCYGVGMIAYAYETRVLGLKGNPGVGDVFFLLQYGFFIAATCLWPSKPLPGAMRWRTWSDAFVLLMALMAFAWAFLIGPAVLEADIGSLAIIIDTAYPVADVLIIFSVLQMMRKGFDPRFRVATHLFVFGLAVNTVGDLYHWMARLENTYQVGAWLDITWPLTASMVGLAGMIAKTRMAVPGFREAKNDDRIVVSQRTWTLYAPYVMVPAVGYLIFDVSRSAVADGIRNGVYACGLGLVVAILIRQLIVIAENGALYASLRDAYDELENKNIQVSLAADETERVNNRLREMTDELSGQNRTLAESNEAL